jgi:hypothetical protein
MSKATITDPVSVELRAVLRTLKLGKLLDTLPERLTLAKQQHLPNADFLELVLADEVARRETNSAALRARTAGLDPGMRIGLARPCPPGSAEGRSLSCHFLSSVVRVVRATTRPPLIT